MVDTVVVRVPGHPPGPNQARHSHWGGRAKQSAEWRGTARICALDAINRQPGRRDARFPFGRARITAVWTYPDRHQRDPDNEVASIKPLIDGLIDAGLIAGDSPKHVEYGEAEHRIVRHVRGIDLRVERLPDMDPT